MRGRRTHECSGGGKIGVLAGSCGEETPGQAGPPAQPRRSQQLRPGPGSARAHTNSEISNARPGQARPRDHHTTGPAFGMVRYGAGPTSQDLTSPTDAYVSRPAATLPAMRMSPVLSVGPIPFGPSSLCMQEALGTVMRPEFFSRILRLTCLASAAVTASAADWAGIEESEINC